MPFQTTSAEVTTVGVTPIISADTTWANTRGAHIQDPVPLAIKNVGNVDLRVTGAATTNSGYPLLVNKEMAFNLASRGDTLNCWTTAGTTGTIELFSGRQ